MANQQFSGKVYLLGAGASAELKFSMTTQDATAPPRRSHLDVLGPLSSGFFYHLNSFAAAVNKHSKQFDCQPGQQLLKYICEQYAPQELGQSLSTKALLNDERQSRKVNIEALFRKLELEQEMQLANTDELSSPKIFQELFRQTEPLRQLRAYLVESLAYICHFCYSEHHRKLASSLESGDVIISFNWDILMEQALRETGTWFYETGYGVTFKKVLHKSNKDYLTQTLPSANLVLKPHGSINWHQPAQSEESVLNLAIPADWGLRGGGGKAIALNQYEQGLGMTKMNAPGSGMFASPDVRDLMRATLEQAGEIIAIGFSFNDLDQHVRDEFTHFSYHNKLTVRLVNPDGENLLPVYREVFPTANVEVAAATFGSFVETLRDAAASTTSSLN